MSKEKLIILAGLLIAVVLSAFIFSILPLGKPPVPPPAVVSAPTPTPAPQDFVLTMGTQKAGIILVASYLEAPKVSWFVIHQDQAGTAGEIVQEGIPAIPVGIYSGMTFLLRDVLTAGTYHGMIHVDDGDTVFDAIKDPPAKNKAGEVVEALFTVK